jgi:hypothetical protein
VLPERSKRFVKLPPPGVDRADSDAVVESERCEPIAERAEWIETFQGDGGELLVDADWQRVESVRAAHWRPG